MQNAAVAVFLGSDSNSGLDYLRLPDDEREIAAQVLKRAVKMHTDNTKYQAYQYAKWMTDGKSDD